MIRTTYPDRICYRPNVMFVSVRVLLPEGVRIGEHAMCPLGGVRMEFAPDSNAHHVSSGGGVPTHMI